MGSGAISKEVKTEAIKLKIDKKAHNVFSMKISNLDSEDLIDKDLSKRRQSNLLELINRKVKTVKNDFDKAELLILRANYYCIKADELSCFSLERIRNFRHALNSFNAAQALQKTNVQAILGIAKCFLRLHQNRVALNYLNQMRIKLKNELHNQFNFWLYYGMAYRNCAKTWSDIYVGSKIGEDYLDEARKCFEEALKLAARDDRDESTEEYDEVELKKQIRIVDNLQDIQNLHKRKFFTYLESVKLLAKNYDLPDRKRKRDFFKILSIDAGGLRGIMPAIVLCEIEKRCNTYLSSVFDLFSGSSTGAMIVSLLTVPDSKNFKKPANNCGVVTEFNLTEAKEIFIRQSKKGKLFQEKIKSKNKQEILKIWFGNTTLRDSLNEIIIPTVYEEEPTKTEYLTRYHARQLSERDFSYVDALMATTAAPKFYESHFIKNFGNFIDGGLTTYNPSLVAYEEAVQRFHKKPEEIFILSLGTGDLATDMLTKDVNNSKDLLPQIVMSSQSHEIDIILEQKLKDRYKRLQFYLETDKTMSNDERLSKLVEKGMQFIQEQSDEINNIVDFLMDH